MCRKTRRARQGKEGIGKVEWLFEVCVLLYASVLLQEQEDARNVVGDSPKVQS